MKKYNAYPVDWDKLTPEQAASKQVWVTDDLYMVPYEGLHGPHIKNILRGFKAGRFMSKAAHKPGLIQELRDRGISIDP